MVAIRGQQLDGGRQSADRLPSAVRALPSVLRLLLVTAYLAGLASSWLAIQRGYSGWTRPVPILALDMAALLIAVAWVAAARWHGMALAALTLFALAGLLERLPRVALAVLPVTVWSAAMFYTVWRFKQSKPESGFGPAWTWRLATLRFKSITKSQRIQEACHERRK